MYCGGTGPPKIYCEIHDGDEIQRFCKTCDIFVCLECIVSEHKGHNLLRIDEFAESKKEDILLLVKKVKSSHLIELQERIQNNREAKRITRQCVSECIKQMNNRAIEIRDYIEKIKTEMIREIKEAQKYEFERLDDIDKYLVTEDNDLKTLVKLIEKAITSNNYTDMIMIGLMLESTILNLEQCPPAKIEELEFCVEYCLEPIMDNLFGYFRERKIIVEADDDKPTDLMVEKRIDPLISFQQAEDSLGCINPMKDGTVWISLTGESIAYLVKHGNIRKKEELDGVIADIDVTKDDHLIVAMKGRHRLLRIKPNGQKLDFIDLKPLYANGLHITNTGDTYVSVIDKDTTEVDNDSKNCVIKYTNTGTGLQRFIKDRKGTRFFTLPRKLVATSDNNICVIDALSLFSGRIVSVSSLYDIKFTYYGRDDLDMVTFNPTAIKRNSRDHIIVADFDNCFLHILNKDGQLLFLMTCNQPECFYGPSALGIDQSDSIWIGTYDGNVTKMTPYAKSKQLPVEDGQKTNPRNMTIGDVTRLKSPYEKPNGTLDSRVSSSIRRKTPIDKPIEKEKSIIKPQSQEKDKSEGKEKTFTRQQSNNAMRAKVKSAMKRRPTLTRMSTGPQRERTLIGESIQENEKPPDLMKNSEETEDKGKTSQEKNTHEKECNNEIVNEKDKMVIEANATVRDSISKENPTNREKSNSEEFKEKEKSLKEDNTKDKESNNGDMKDKDKIQKEENKSNKAVNDKDKSIIEETAKRVEKTKEDKKGNNKQENTNQKESKSTDNSKITLNNKADETKSVDYIHDLKKEQLNDIISHKQNESTAQKNGKPDVSPRNASVQKNGGKSQVTTAHINAVGKGSTKAVNDYQIPNKEVEAVQNKPIGIVSNVKADNKPAGTVTKAKADNKTTGTVTKTKTTNKPIGTVTSANSENKPAGTVTNAKTEKYPTVTMTNVENKPTQSVSEVKENPSKHSNETTAKTKPKGASQKQKPSNAHPKLSNQSEIAANKTLVVSMSIPKTFSNKNGKTVGDKNGSNKTEKTVDTENGFDKTAKIVGNKNGSNKTVTTVGNKNGSNKTGKTTDDKTESVPKQQNNDDQKAKRKRHQCEMTNQTSGSNKTRNKDEGQQPKSEKVTTGTSSDLTIAEKNKNTSNKNGNEQSGVLQTAIKHVRK